MHAPHGSRIVHAPRTRRYQLKENLEMIFADWRALFNRADLYEKPRCPCLYEATCAQTYSTRGRLERHLRHAHGRGRLSDEEWAPLKAGMDAAVQAAAPLRERDQLFRAHVKGSVDRAVRAKRAIDAVYNMQRVRYAPYSKRRRHSL